jgi:hypothetical protein
MWGGWVRVVRDERIDKLSIERLKVWFIVFGDFQKEDRTLSVEQGAVYLVGE